MPRFFCPSALAVGLTLDLPAGAARHVQVLRLQPGDALTLFNNGPSAAEQTHQASAGEFFATVTQMGRSQVQVHVDSHQATEREAMRRVSLAVAMPANERMDWLVEKATELGVAAVQPLMSQHSVLRLSADRAEKKIAHWQSIAIAACEQCGGNRVPSIYPLRTLAQWLQAQASQSHARLLLSLQPDAPLVAAWAMHSAPSEKAVVVLSGPEGGFSAGEEAAAVAEGFLPTSLGVRVLRAETAALAALARLT